jgi:RimJ/RimL family protein N-acetyltransferase
VTAGRNDSGPADAAGVIRAARLDLHPLTVADAAEMVNVLSAPELYEFTGGVPPTEGELRDRYARQAAGRSPDGSEEWRNWIIRARPGGPAMGYVQATITQAGTLAEIAWVVGLPWQGRGYASEAARALVGWLDRRGVRMITARIHPDHSASAAVARRAGLRPTPLIRDGERVWRRGLPSPAGPSPG